MWTNSRAAMSTASDEEAAGFVEALVGIDDPRQIAQHPINAKRFPAAAEIAAELGLSLRTLHRKLAEDGTSYHSIVNEMRRSIALSVRAKSHAW